MITLAIIAQKGGTGKTTTAHATAAGLAARGYKVLLIDADAQGNLTYVVDPPAGAYTLYDVLTRRSGIREATRQAEGLSFIGASPALATADLAITHPGKEYELLNALQQVSGEYDYCIIDTPPALGIITINALAASTEAVIVAQADIFSLQAIGALHATIQAVKQSANPALGVNGILITRHNPRTILSRDMMELLEDTARHLDTRVYEARIREATAVKEAQAMKADLFSYSPNSNPAQDYSAYIGELLREEHHE